MAQQHFQAHKHKKQDTNFDNDVWFENTLLPDVVLSDVYEKEKKENMDTLRQAKGVISQFHIYNDPAFQENGSKLLIRLLKLIVLRKRIYLSWIETELWKKAYESQSSQMELNKKGWIGTLPPLKFDLLDFIDLTTIEDEELEEKEIDDEDEEDSYQQNFIEDGSIAPLKLGALAITEFEVSMGTCLIENLKDINRYLKRNQTQRLVRILKIQLAEKVFFLSAVHTNCIVMAEIYLRYLQEGYQKSMKKVESDNNARKTRYQRAM